MTMALEWGKTIFYPGRGYSWCSWSYPWVKKNKFGQISSNKGRKAFGLMADAFEYWPKKSRFETEFGGVH
jgi:hypothetical protein